MKKLRSIFLFAALGLLALSCRKGEQAPSYAVTRGMLTCQVVPLSAEPEFFHPALQIAMRSAMEHFPPPTRSATLTIEQLPATTRGMAKWAFPHANATMQENHLAVRLTEDPIRLAYRLTHELTHWLVWNDFGNHPPLWLDEGFAAYVAAQSLGPSSRRFKMDPVQLDILANISNSYTLDTLTALQRYPRKPEEVAAFYWQSEQLVRELHRILGKDDFTAFMKAVGQKHPKSKPPDWRSYLRRKYYFNASDFKRLEQVITIPNTTPNLQ